MGSWVPGSTGADPPWSAHPPRALCAGEAQPCEQQNVPGLFINGTQPLLVLCGHSAFCKELKGLEEGIFLLKRLKRVEIGFPSVTESAPRSWAASSSSNAPDWENVQRPFLLIFVDTVVCFFKIASV